MSGARTVAEEVSRNLEASYETALRRVFAQVFKLDEATVAADMTPDTVDAWDSFGHMQLITAVETALRIKLTMEQVVAIDSFAALSRVVGEAAPQ